jgi:hypothetical protein
MTTQQARTIHVQGLEKSYKTLHVLRGIDIWIASPGASASSLSRTSSPWSSTAARSPDSTVTCQAGFTGWLG